VDWNLITKDVFASSSWDHTVKIVSDLFIFICRKIKEKLKRSGKKNTCMKETREIKYIQKCFY
jgi:hypothetical protein